LTRRDDHPDWVYRSGEELPEIVVLFDGSEDSQRLLSFLSHYEIPVTKLPSDGRDPEEWPNSALPAVYLPSESRGGRTIVFRGLRQIQNQFLARFDFSSLSGRSSLVV